MSNSPFITQAESLQNIQESYQLLNAKLDKKENIANKVQVINKESTEVEYPSAKSVYDFVNEYVKTENILPTSEIMTLVASNVLIPGNYYLINDFQTIYTIPGSNSEAKIISHTVNTLVEPWCLLEMPDINLVYGKEVTVNKLPDGYSGPIVIGSKATVTYNYADYYFAFSNGMHKQIGFGFSYEMPRYSNGLADNLVVNDSNGRPVIKPGGVLNTEVHDGTPYMLMTAEENLSVPVESIILIAKSTNEFELIGKSITYIDDIIEYKLPVEGSDAIKGTILRRSNRALGIDVPIDWRVVRYRRWRLDSDSILKLLNQNITVEDSLTRVGTAFQFTAINSSVSTPNRFFVAKALDDTSLTLDKYTKIVKFPMIVSSQSDAKDYTIFPLDENRNPLNTSLFKVKEYLGNVVIQNNEGEVNSGVEIEVSEIYNTTGVCSTVIRQDLVSDSLFLDSVNIKGQKDNTVFSNVVSLSYLQLILISNTTLETVILGASTNDYNKFPGPGAGLSTRWLIIEKMTDCTMKNCAIGGASTYFNFFNTLIENSTIYAFRTYQNEYSFYLSGLAVTFNNNKLISMTILNRAESRHLVFNDIYCSSFESVPGPSFRDLYINTDLIDSVKVTRNKFNKKLYYKELDINDVETIKTYATLTVPVVIP